MRRNEYRLLTNKLKPAIATPIFVALFPLVFGKPNLSIFEFSGALIVGCFSSAMFYYLSMANVQAEGADFGASGNPIVLADRYADGYLFMAFFAYLFFFVERDMVRKMIWLIGIAGVALYLGELIAVVVLERRIGERIMIARAKGQDIADVFLGVIVGFVAVAYALGRTM